MNEQGKQTDKVSELEDFYYKLTEYLDILPSSRRKTRITEDEKERGARLLEVIVRQVGYLGKLITELTGVGTVDLHGTDYDMWLISLRTDNYSLAANALEVCIQVTNRAIGQLEGDIKNGIRDKGTGLLVTTQSKMITEAPKVFIVHGGKSSVLEKLREFVEALGIKPLIVEMLPSKGMTLADKVKKYQQEADCAIILATRGGIIDTKSGKQHPRLNVIDELSSFWEAFPERVIVLLEKGAQLPSNKSGLTYEAFARQSMDRAFIAIARELTEMKILKAVKPLQE